MVRDAFTDTIGVVMVGIDQPVTEIVRSTLVRGQDRGEARACLSSERLSAPDAALARRRHRPLPRLRRPVHVRTPQRRAWFPRFSRRQRCSGRTGAGDGHRIRRRLRGLV